VRVVSSATSGKPRPEEAADDSKRLNSTRFIPFGSYLMTIVRGSPYGGMASAVAFPPPTVTARWRFRASL
jgi:hypothetical protein